MVQIGFNKCGTRSLQQLFEGAGYPVVQHKSGQPHSIGPDKNILKLRPPLVLRESDADFMLGVLDESLTALASKARLGSNL